MTHRIPEAHFLRFGYFRVRIEMTIHHDISYARDLLERADKEIDYTLRAQFILEAIELLDNCESDDISPYERTLIANLRVSYTRRFLTQFITFKSVTMDEFLGYAALFFFILKDEKDLVLEENPQLKEDFHAFVRLRRQELRRRLKPSE